MSPALWVMVLREAAIPARPEPAPCKAPAAHRATAGQETADQETAGRAMVCPETATPIRREPAPCKALAAALETAGQVWAYAGRAFREPAHREAADRLARIRPCQPLRAPFRMAAMWPLAVSAAETLDSRASPEAFPRAWRADPTPASGELREHQIPAGLLQRARGKCLRAHWERAGRALRAAPPPMAIRDSPPPANRERRAAGLAMVPTPPRAAGERRATRGSIR